MIQADICEALEQVKKWKPVYLSLLCICKNKEDALKALRFLIELTNGEL